MSENQKADKERKINANEVLIEEIDSNDVPENELAQFEVTEPLRVVEIIDLDDEDSMPPSNEALKAADEEGALIRRYVQGVQCLEFPDFCTKLEPGDEEDDSEAAHLASKQKHESYEQIQEEPSTSAAAAATASKQSAPPKTQSKGSFGRAAAGGSLGRRSQLSAALMGLMGEANLSFAYGRFDVAERICMEIIRQNPLASEPFYTLAEIYENRDEVKFLHFSTIAAHLNPQDRDMWIRISDLLVQQGHLTRARICYTKAIRVLPKEYLLRQRKAQLLERMGETNAAMFTYLKMLPLMPSSEWSLCLSTGKNVACYFHELKKHSLALEAMEGTYGVCGDRFTNEDLNIYLELLILNKQYIKVLRCLRERTKLELETEQESLELIYFCQIPDDYVPELRAKLCVSLIHMHAHHLLGYIVQNVQEYITPTVDRVELYMDITEALMQEHKYAEAIALMRPITDSDSFDCPAFVWLRHAECLRQLNRTQEAIQSYERVVQLAPYCYEAKFTLSALLKQQGRPEEAVKALEQSGEQEGQPLHARLLYERCIMLQQINRIDEFLDVGYVLLSRHSIKLKNREEMMAASNGGGAYNTEGLKAILQMRSLADVSGGADSEQQELHKKSAPANAEGSDLTIKNEYELFLELVRTAHAHGMHSIVERICFAMVTTRRFTYYHYEIERIMILGCYFNHDCAIAFSYLRELIAKHPDMINLWNMLSLMVQQGDEVRYFRYARRLLERHPKATQPMRLFLGHYHLNCSSYKYALNAYVPILREQPHPLVALSIAAVFNQLGLQKKVLRKSAAVAQAVAFALRYAELRAGCSVKGSDVPATCAAQQEIYYNIGRIYHQANILHLAIDYYERALAAQHPLIKQHESVLGLQHEVAFNLHLIYRSSGNKWKARQCLMRYCVV
ncbi:PREDICTED: general transcription factor 3C polypeptide 3 [Drosophila arizonae]|uniref:General transcription factor 3C polypeptide 3 n=1 Tax=Drosophila arizonae TaxID=7263 RepID=A0ABM1PNP6_DROAR|nr:PREDICTED: general transcription factor 3C polypeptide 3 [Drosophila arizonae]